MASQGDPMTPAEFKARREALGFQIYELAVALGVTPSAVYLWEAGKRPINKITELALRQVEQEVAPERAPTSP